MLSSEFQRYSGAVQALADLKPRSNVHRELSAWSRRLRDTAKRLDCCLRVLEEMKAKQVFPDATLVTQLVDILNTDSKRSLCYQLFALAHQKKQLDQKLLGKMILICKSGRATEQAQKVHDLALEQPSLGDQKIYHVYMQIMGKAMMLDRVTAEYRRLLKAKKVTARTHEIYMRQCNRCARPDLALQAYTARADEYLKKRSYLQYIDALGRASKQAKLLEQWQKHFPARAQDIYYCPAFLRALAAANLLSQVRQTYLMATAGALAPAHEIGIAYMQAEGEIGDRAIAEHVYEQLIEAGASFYDATKVFLNYVDTDWKESCGRWDYFRETEEFIWTAD